jgi:hypothetical protein
VWLKADSPLITMSGADAGVSFWSSHHPERGTTATVISTTIVSRPSARHFAAQTASGWPA